MNLAKGAEKFIILTFQFFHSLKFKITLKKLRVKK